MANQNNNKKKPGQGGGLRIVDFVFDGTKANGAIEFRALQGNQGRVGVQAEFYLGTATRRFASQLREGGNKAWSITTVNGGIGQREIDLSDPVFKEFSRLTICPPHIAAAPATGGTFSVPTFEPITLDLPSDEQSPSKTPKKKRLQFAAPESALKSRRNNYTLPTIRTLNKDGKGESADLLFRVSDVVTLNDVRTGTTLVTDQKVFEVKTAANGLLLAEVQFAGSERRMTIIHLETGEETSLKMEFEY